MQHVDIRSDGTDVRSRPERIAFLKCEDDSPAYDQRLREIVVVAEDETGWRGWPLSNPQCPVVLYPRLAWKEVDNPHHGASDLPRDGTDVRTTWTDSSGQTYYPTHRRYWLSTSTDSLRSTLAELEARLPDEIDCIRDLQDEIAGREAHGDRYTYVAQ